MAKDVETKPLNEADDARDDVRAAIAQLKGDTQEAAPVEDHPEPEVIEPEPVAEPVQAEPVAKDDHPTDPARFADGTFKPTKAEAAPKVAAPAKEITPSTDIQTKASAPAPTPTSAPPAGWTAAEKAEWQKLPPAVQAAVSRRETEIANGGKQWSDEKRHYQAILAPIEQASRARGLDVNQGAQLLAAAQNALDANPIEGIRRIMATYGVTPEHLLSEPPASQPQVRDPVIPQISQKISTLENQLYEFQMSQTNGLLEAFASSHPHFAAVENEIASLIPVIQNSEPGLPKQQVLQKAYDQAVWLNPTVRAQLIAEQTASAEQARVATLQTKQTQARKAAVSVKGSSNGVSPPPVMGNNGGDVYDDVRAAIAQLRG